ncbi:MAG: hypothetical protein A2V57_10450 [Candidatus Aminicenantes bacterium RBG_19FT_COMBO_65_30]|nr:MAG: hypothetical protein A2V57_10450 [Candidatus Aminicenantes bacterium RBG_19FT_COMBO_65_30]
MRFSVRPARAFLPGILLLLAAAPVLGGGGLERALFKDIPATDPTREVIQAVLGSPFFSMRGGFAAKEWAGGGYGEAWERARRYFPNNTYFVRPGTYFMTHGFGPDGRLFMEVHESAYLTLCVENRRTFTAGSIVGEYGRMLGAADGREAAAFREKTGRLEPLFRDETAHRSLRKALGEALYLRLLEELREENYHMLAGGLMHEGMHAGMDDALVARIQAEFKSGGRSVQWDEMRAFMAEMGCHGPFCKWAEGDIAASWSKVKDLLGELEALRKRPRLRPGPDERRFEKTRAKAWVFAALVRLRMREVWQSARRMRGLLESFRKDYIKAEPPAEVDDLLTKLARDTAGFVAAAGVAIQKSELALRFLEEILDQWSEWAAGRRPFPPPVTDSNDVAKRTKNIAWPDPPADGPGALMKRAESEIAKLGLDKPLPG